MHRSKRLQCAIISLMLFFALNPAGAREVNRPRFSAEIALRLNQRPRQTLGFKTPAYKLQTSVALTH